MDVIEKLRYLHDYATDIINRLALLGCQWSKFIQSEMKYKMK